MISEDRNNLNPEEAEVTKDAERARRQESFSRRGLLQWTIPAIVAVSLPQVAFGSAHTDSHDDSFVDTHHDGHTDMDKVAGPGGKGSSLTNPQSGSPESAVRRVP